MRICPGCTAANDDQNAFCNHCGRDLRSAHERRADPAGPVHTPHAPRYAGFRRRLAAVIVDAFVMVPVGLVVQLLTGPGVSFVLNTVIGTAYVVLMHRSKHQATLGKMAVGIIVTDLKGHRISGWRALWREIAEWISALTFGIGYLMVIWTRKKQSLYDMMARTLVVHREAPVRPAGTAVQVEPRERPSRRRDDELVPHREAPVRPAGTAVQVEPRERPSRHRDDKRVPLTCPSCAWAFTLSAKHLEARPRFSCPACGALHDVGAYQE